MNVKDYTKGTQTYLKQIVAYLTEKYGKVQPQWNATLTTIADNLDLMAECKASIKQYGIYNERTGRKNPLIATVKDLQATNLKCYQQLGLTPWAESKIKSEETDADAELLQKLMGE